MEELKEQRPASANKHDDEVYEVSLLDLLVILAKKRWIIKVTAIFAVVAIIYSLLATPIYKSELQIMPPSSGGKMPGAAALLAASGLGDILGSGALTTTSDTIVGITKSPAVLDRVIDKNGLLTRKPEGFSLGVLISKLFPSDKPRMRTKVRESLSGVIDVAADKKSNIITVVVKDTSPDMAMKIVQSVFDETQDTLKNVALTPEALQRTFLESQLKDSYKSLAEAEQKLVKYQAKTGIIETGDGSKSPIADGLAMLQAQMAAKEVELRAAQQFGTSSNPQVKRLQAEYNAIKAQFEQNRSKIGTAPLSGIGVRNLPEAAAEYTTLMRDYKFREALLQMLLKQYEAAKLNEANDPVVIQMLSKPTVPELKDSPNRRKIVLLATLLGAFLGIFMAFISHFIELSATDPKIAPKLDYVRQSFCFRKRKKV